MTIQNNKNILLYRILNSKISLGLLNILNVELTLNPELEK